MGYLQALKLEHRAQKMRKDGKDTGIQLYRRLPTFTVNGGFGGTIEASVLHNVSQKIYNVVKIEFYNLPPEIQHSLLFAPKSYDGWLERAKIWGPILKAALEIPFELYTAQAALAEHYVKCMNRHTETKNCVNI